MGFKISQLPAIPSCLATDIIAEVQPAVGGTTYKATLQQIFNLFSSMSTFSSLPYTNVTTTSQAMSANNGYVSNNAALVTLTLPVTAAFGSVIEIIGLGAGGWSVAQNAGQSIKIGIQTSTVGAGGSVSSSNPSDSVKLVCIVANTVWANCGGPQSSILTII